MQGKGLEYIPTRLGKPERKTPGQGYNESDIETLYKRKRKSSKMISTILNMEQMISFPLKTPECFSWFEVPIKVQVIDDYTQVYRKMTANTEGDKDGDTYIYKKTYTGRVACLVKIKMMPSGMYNIVSIQCEYSKEGVKSLEDFLGNAWDAGIGEDCKNYQVLCNFFDNILANFSGKD